MNVKTLHFVFGTSYNRCMKKKTDSSQTPRDQFTIILEKIYDDNRVVAEMVVGLRDRIDDFEQNVNHKFETISKELHSVKLEGMVTHKLAADVKILDRRVSKIESRSLR